MLCSQSTSCALQMYRRQNHRLQQAVLYMLSTCDCFVWTYLEEGHCKVCRFKLARCKKLLLALLLFSGPLGIIRMPT